MPLTAEYEERTIYIKPQDLARYIRVTPGYLSKATHQDWLAGGVPPAEWVVWNRKHTRVKGYEVPESQARHMIPIEEFPNYDLEPNA